MKEELLLRRSQLMIDKENLERSNKTLYFVYDGLSSFRNLLFGEEYLNIVILHIIKEIQEIDNKLGI